MQSTIQDYDNTFSTHHCIGGGESKKGLEEYTSCVMDHQAGFINGRFIQWIKYTKVFEKII
jgi:hypothetical protein